jgi:hypothetical protein
MSYAYGVREFLRSAPEDTLILKHVKRIAEIDLGAV